jgi:hypothetical protein
MSILLIPILWALSIVLSSHADAKGPFGSIHIGNWKGGAFTNDSTGKFSHCAAVVGYTSGIDFAVSINLEWSWTLGFAHRAWQLSPGEVIPIDLTFDGKGQYHVFGTAQTENMVFVPMPNSSALLRDFRKSATMAAVARGSVFGFNLNATSQLLPALTSCVATISKHGLTAAGDFTVKPAPQPPPSAGGPPTTVTSSLKTESIETNPQEFQIEAIQLASNFILKSALQNPRVLARDSVAGARPVACQHQHRGLGF